MSENTLAGAGEPHALLTARNAIPPFFVGMLTLVLTLYLAFQSSELHTADLALREYQDLVNERPQEKLYQAWKMFRFEGVLALSKPPLKALDDYQKLAEATRDLGEKRSAILRLLVEASELHIVPPAFERSWSPSGAAADGLGGAMSSAYPQGPAASIASPGESAPAAASGATAFAYPEARQQDDTCDSLPLRAPGVDTGIPGRMELAAHMRGIDCFLRTLNISSSDYNYPMWTAIYKTRNKVSLLVAWLLPGLYGLLGACVFLMRQMLGQDSALNGGVVRVLGVLSILLRIALGGLAGIIVGWFWVPTSAASAGSAISVPSIAFGVAFLAGFSIEGLFAMLDRLNRTLGAEPSVRPAGSAAPAAPAATAHA